MNLMKSKKTTKYIWILPLIIVMITTLYLCSCTQKTAQNYGAKDIYGRSVDIPEQVDKIATIGSATRLCVYAGVQDKLIAITEMDRPSELRPYTIANKELFSQLPVTNNGNHINSTNVDKEKLLDLNPDIIISTRNKEECEKLQNEIKIPVIGVYFQDEMFGENVYDSINLIGKVCKNTEQSDATVNYLKRCEKELTNIQKETGNNNRVYRGAINFKGSKGLTGTISNYCVYQSIGIKNMADKEGLNSAYDTSTESIIEWNPEYIFADCTNYNKVQRDLQNNTSALEQVDAVKNKQIYYVAPFNNNGTNIEYGLCEAYYTAKMLNLSSFSNLNLDEKIDEIFYNLDGNKIYQELKEKGIWFGQH